MSDTIFTGTFNSTTMIPVPVIASFDAYGNVLPLYIGFDGESYKVLSSIPHSEIKIKTFKCKLDVYGRIRNVTLTFHPEQSIWTIPKRTQ